MVHRNQPVNPPKSECFFKAYMEKHNDINLKATKEENAI